MDINAKLISKMELLHGVLRFVEDSDWRCQVAEGCHAKTNQPTNPDPVLMIPSYYYAAT